jgi:cell division protein FtsI/penicillin-binding protein 2/beta-lactamase regulating signal transducer with metallopeptidase domain
MKAFLQSLIESDLTQRAGLTLAHTLWQGCAIALALTLVLRFMRHASASARHTVACAALFLLLAAPVVTFFRLDHAQPAIATSHLEAMLPVSMEESPRQVQAPPIIDLDPATMERPAGSTFASKAAPSAPLPWHAWTVIAWLAGMMMLTFWHGMGWVQLQRLHRRNVTPWPADLTEMARRMAVRMGLRFTPRLLWSTRVSGPVAFGCWQTVVLLPASMASGFTVAQLEMILAHEFAHLRRHDYLINLCQTVATTLLFFHPATWWIHRVIHREREHACDDLAVAAVGDAAAYARTLVSLAERELTGAPALAAATLERKGVLRHRIARLLHPPPSRLATRFWPGVAMLTLAAVTWQALPNPPTIAQAPAAGGKPVRGDILDRHGVVLATGDREEPLLCFTLRDVAHAWIAEHGPDFPRTTRAVPRTEEDFKKNWFTESTEANPNAKTETNALTMEIEVPDIVRMFEAIVLPKLRSAALARPFNSQRMRGGYGGSQLQPSYASTKEAQAAVGPFGTKPAAVWSLTPEEAEKARGLVGNIPGLSVSVEKLRHYPFAAMASHVLGYARLTDADATEEESGAYGVEHQWDNRLKPTAPPDGTPLQRGTDVYLTLDARYQTIVERTLRESQPRIARGAVVLLEVNTGDVLAMASAPSFDPNDFVPFISQEKFTIYSKDETNPLLNRAVRGFVPGSTFLVATSLAAICSGHENDRFDCKGGTTFNGRYMQCWIGQKGGAHGPFGLREAIAASCGPYFYQLGNAAGNDALWQTGSLCGLGRTSGILEEEASGILPLKKWWETNRPRDPYTPATIANISIGQGAVLTTPLQLASLTAIVANGGTVWKPRLVDRIAPHGDATKAEAQPRVRAADLRAEGLTASGLALLREGMEDVVHSETGTARAARSQTIRIAGKTGTAQNWRTENGTAVRDNHTWFICYAPAEKPKWAMAVLVQGGKSGGVSAAPIARHIFEQISAVESGTLTIEPRALPPIEGNFKPVEQVEVPLKPAA